MMADAPRRRLDIVLAEAVDRTARRTADTTDHRDVRHYHRVELHAASIGLVAPVHAAILGDVADEFQSPRRQNEERPSGDSRYCMGARIPRAPYASVRRPRRWTRRNAGQLGPK
jgi:hypothetical protein